MHNNCCTSDEVSEPAHLAGTTPGTWAHEGNLEPVYAGPPTSQVTAPRAMRSPSLFRANTHPSTTGSAQARLLGASRAPFVRRNAGSPVLPRPHPAWRTSPDGGGNLPGG